MFKFLPFLTILVMLVSCNGKTDKLQTPVSANSQNLEQTGGKESETVEVKNSETKIVDKNNKISKENMQNGLSSFEFGFCKADGNLENLMIDCEKSIKEFRVYYVTGEREKSEIFSVFDLPVKKDALTIVKNNEHLFELISLHFYPEITKIETQTDDNVVSVLLVNHGSITNGGSYEQDRFSNPVVDPKDRFFDLTVFTYETNLSCRIFGTLKEIKVDCEKGEDIHITFDSIKKRRYHQDKIDNTNIQVSRNVPFYDDYAILKINFDKNRKNYYDRVSVGIDVKKGKVFALTKNEARKLSSDLEEENK